MDEKIVEQAYQRLFASSDGKIVMDDFRRLCAIDEPIGILEENELRNRVAWQDFFKTIETITKGAE